MTIATLTMNPTVDVSFEVDRVYHTHKMRGRAERHDPGGGGINVARVLARLGDEARCFYLAGGSTGAALDRLLDRHRLVRTCIPIRGETRVSTAVLERETGCEYRFVADGPAVSSAEWQHCEALLAEANYTYLVASGSLPQGVPDDFYARLARTAKSGGKRFVLDSSGAGLAGGLAGGDVFLVKLSIGELRKLTGQALETDAEIVETAMAIVERGGAEHIAVTLGRNGALLVNRSGALRLPALPIEALSAVGAGDSFVAGMVHALAAGQPVEDAFRNGIAAGGAAVLTPGTGLALGDDIARLYAAAAALEPLAA